MVTISIGRKTLLVLAVVAALYGAYRYGYSSGINAVVNYLQQQAEGQPQSSKL